MAKSKKLPAQAGPRRYRRKLVFLLIVIGVGLVAVKHLKSTQDLRAAIIGHDVAAARRALYFGADVEYQQPTGWERTPGDTLLTMAAQQGQPEMIKLLLDWGADPHRAGPRVTPLDGAFFSGNLEAVKTLVDAGSELPVGSNGQPMAQAISQDRADLVDYLLDHGASVSAPHISGYPPLHYAVLLGKPDMVKLLLDRGADPAASFGDVPPAREVAERSIEGFRESAAEHRKGAENPGPHQAPPAPPLTEAEIEQAVKKWQDCIDVIDAHQRAKGDAAPHLETSASPETAAGPTQAD
jgi:hypothetical protein